MGSAKSPPKVSSATRRPGRRASLENIDARAGTLSRTATHAGHALAGLDIYRPLQRWTHVDGDNVFIAAHYGPTLAVVYVRGFAGRAMTEVVRESLATILRGDQLVFYWDIFEMRQFDAEFREAVVAQLLSARKRLRAVPLVVDSPLIAMAAAATNITLGGPLRVYRQREPFEAELRRDLAVASLDRVG